MLVRVDVGPAKQRCVVCLGLEPSPKQTQSSGHKHLTWRQSRAAALPGACPDPCSQSPRLLSWGRGCRRGCAQCSPLVQAAEQEAELHLSLLGSRWDRGRFPFASKWGNCVSEMLIIYCDDHKTPLLSCCHWLFFIKQILISGLSIYMKTSLLCDKFCLYAKDKHPFSLILGC